MRVPIREVPFPGVAGKKAVQFLFDDGDGWHFGVKLVPLTAEAEPGPRRPQVVASQGQAPPQYAASEDDP